MKTSKKKYSKINKTRSKKGGAQERRWYWNDGEWLHFTWNQWQRIGGTWEEWLESPYALFQGDPFTEDYLIPPPDLGINDEGDEDQEQIYLDMLQERDRLAERRHQEASASTRPICDPDHNCETMPMDPPCLGGMCKTCDGKEDPIMYDTIPSGKGICIDKQCYNVDNLRTALEHMPELPHNRRLYSLEELNRAMTYELNCKPAVSSTRTPRRAVRIPRTTRKRSTSKSTSPKRSKSKSTSPEPSTKRTRKQPVQLEAVQVITPDPALAPNPFGTPPSMAEVLLMRLRRDGRSINNLAEAQAILQTVSDFGTGEELFTAAEQIAILIDLVQMQSGERISPGDARIALEQARGDMETASQIIYNRLGFAGGKKLKK